LSAPSPISVIAITSGKGGVGKTNVAVNLSVSLAEQGRSVVLFDADLGLANVDIALGIKSKFNISHVISGERTLEEIIVEGPQGIRIVPATSGVSSMTTLSVQERGGLVRAFSDLSFEIDTLIVDIGAGIDQSVQNFASACQEIIVVICDEPASITDAYALIKVLNKECGVKRFHVLANMVESESQGRQLYGKIATVADRFLDVHLGFLGAIPRDEFLRKAVQQQRPVTQLYPGSKSSLAFKKLADVVQSSFTSQQTSGGLGFFVERLIQGSLGGGT
jgi:flagellar biosynthesis protein FlhG